MGFTVKVAALYLILAGFWFGQVQTVGLFVLQCFFTAAIPAYILCVSAWLFGAGLGVWLGRKLGWWYWIVCGLSLGLFLVLVTGGNAVVLWGLLVICALPAGGLFQEQLPNWPDSGAMFGWEAAGFVAGLIVSTFAIMSRGLTYCELVPWESLGLTLIAGRVRAR